MARAEAEAEERTETGVEWKALTCVRDEPDTEAADSQIETAAVAPIVTRPPIAARTPLLAAAPNSAQIPQAKIALYMTQQ